MFRRDKKKKSQGDKKIEIVITKNEYGVRTTHPRYYFIKFCIRCETEKLLTDFNRRAASEDGRRAKCKECEKIVTAERLQVLKIAKAEQDRVSKSKASAKKYRQSPKYKAVIKKYREKYPERIKAISVLNCAIRSGKIKRASHCESCSKERFTEGHHESYEKEDWLKVNWLCVRCHRKLHGLLRLKIKIQAAYPLLTLSPSCSIRGFCGMKAVRGY